MVARRATGRPCGGALDTEVALSAPTLVSAGEDMPPGSKADWGETG